MTSILEAGFVFWGLFLVFGLIIVGYLIWMSRVEREEQATNGNPNEEGEAET